MGGLAALAGCSSEPAETSAKVSSGIVGGSPTPLHEGVVFVLSEKAKCTGVIVAVDVPRRMGWVLTSAACADIKPVVVRRTLDDSTLFGYWVLDAVKHPQASTTVAARKDLAVVRVLGVDESTPVTPLVSGTDGVGVGTPIKLVGFASTGVRSVVETTVVRVDADEIDWNQGASGACDGDVGAPVLSAAGTVVGIVSSYGPPCRAPSVVTSVGGWASRVATDLPWIRQQLARTEYTDSCDLCRHVAQSGKQPGAGPRRACANHPACSQLLACEGACKDSSCVTACVDRNPLGLGLHVAWQASLCGACPTQCAAAPECAARPRCLLSMPQGDCRACSESRCCDAMSACAVDSTCHACEWTHDRDPACATNPLRAALASCEASQCSGACSPAPPSDGGVPNADATPAAPSGERDSAPGESPASAGCRSAPGGAGSSSWIAVALAVALRRRRRPPTPPSASGATDAGFFDEREAVRREGRGRVI